MCVRCSHSLLAEFFQSNGLNHSVMDQVDSFAFPKELLGCKLLIRHEPVQYRIVMSPHRIWDERKEVGLQFYGRKERETRDGAKNEEPEIRLRR